MRIFTNSSRLVTLKWEYRWRSYLYRLYCSYSYNKIMIIYIILFTTLLMDGFHATLAELKRILLISPEISMHLMMVLIIIIIIMY